MTGINFADETMTISQGICEKSALENGCNEFIKYSPDDIAPSFYSINREIFVQKRGYGYWLWKPYFLYRTMLQSNENEIIVYLDSGVEVVNSLNYIKDRMEGDIWLFGNEHRHAEWCKNSVLRAMLLDISHLEGNYERIDNSRQVQASVIFVKNTKFAREFVKKWLVWCQMPNFIDDSPLIIQFSNPRGFIEHRHDQAILTNLAIKYGERLHWWPTQYGHSIKTNYPKDNYPQLFNHHRKRNNEW